MLVRHQFVKARMVCPGNLQQHAYAKRYNRVVIYDWLRHSLLASIEKV